MQKLSKIIISIILVVVFIGLVMVWYYNPYNFLGSLGYQSGDRVENVVAKDNGDFGEGLVLSGIKYHTLGTNETTSLARCAELKEKYAVDLGALRSSVFLDYKNTGTEEQKVYVRFLSGFGYSKELKDGMKILKPNEIKRFSAVFQADCYSPVIVEVIDSITQKVYLRKTTLGQP